MLPIDSKLLRLRYFVRHVRPQKVCVVQGFERLLLDGFGQVQEAVEEHERHVQPALRLRGEAQTAVMIITNFYH